MHDRNFAVKSISVPELWPTQEGFQPGRMNTPKGDYFRLINVARDSARDGIEKFVTPAARTLAKILIHSALDDENDDCADC